VDLALAHWFRFTAEKIIHEVLVDACSIFALLAPVLPVLPAPFKGCALAGSAVAVGDVIDFPDAADPDNIERPR